MASTGAEEFAALARRLKDAGETGLRRALYKAINDACKPLAREIGNVDHLRPYLPDRYADVLASDLSVTTSKLTGRDPGIRIRAQGRVHDRKVILLNDGLIRHPVFARGPRPGWKWKTQSGGMQRGFFDDPVNKAGPQVREAILAAMHDVAQKIEKG